MSEEYTARKGPVVIEAGDLPDAPAPQDAPPIEDDAAETAAVLRAARLSGRGMSLLARVFWASAASLVAMAIGVAAWDFVTGLMDRNTVLGRMALALGALVVLALAGLVLREIRALGRLASIEKLRARVQTARADPRLASAQAVSAEVLRFYRGRPEVSAARERIARRAGEMVEPGDVLDMTERETLVAFDAQALAEVRAASRQVAAVTALVPLALADVLVALTANIRMIRRIAEVYGGRAGLVGSWRLFRAVASHLVATGAVAVGDDVIGGVLGGGMLARVSRRFGEGMINGILTARVGVAAMEVCRPMPFAAVARPSVTQVARRALKGLVDRDAAQPR